MFQVNERSQYLSIKRQASWYKNGANQPVRIPFAIMVELEINTLSTYCFALSGGHV